MPESSHLQPLYNRNFALTIAAQTSFVVAATSLAHYARWIEFLGGDVGQVGVIMGAGAIVGLLLRPWMGQWINRLGARRTWAIGCIVFSLSACGNLLLADLSPLIYVLRSGLVLGAAIVFASSLTYITHAAPPERRTEAIGILGVGGFIGMLFGPAIGDVLLGDRERGDFVALFYWSAAGCLLPMVLLSFLKAAPGQGAAMPVQLRDFVQTVRHHWPGAILLVAMTFGVCMTVPFVFLASYIDEVRLVIPGVPVIGVFFWCYAGWGLIVRVSLRRTADHLGRRKMVLAGMMFMTLGMLSFWLVDPARSWSIVVPALILGTGHGLMYHTMTSLTVQHFPSAVGGTGAALTLMMVDIGLILGSPVLGQIARRLDYNWMFTAIGLFCLINAAAYSYTSVPVWRERWRQRQFSQREQVRETVGPCG